MSSPARSRFRALAVAVLALAITGTTATAAHAEPSAAELTKQIEKASHQLEDVVESYNDMKIQLAKTQAEQVNLTKSLGPAKDALKVAAKDLNTIAASSYRDGEIGSMRVVFNGPENVLDRMSYLEQLRLNRQRKIENYTATTRDYDARQAALKETRTKQTAQVAELAKRKKVIEANLKNLYKMRTAAYGKAEETGTKYTGSVPNISGSAGVVVKFAYAQIGKMYGWGQSGPNQYDCSGLTSAAWAKAGKSLPHSAAQQRGVTAWISKSQLQEGDLVFYRGTNAPGHVAIYVGGGQIIDASTAGQPIKKRSINVMTPSGYGRVK